MTIKAQNASNFVVCSPDLMVYLQTSMFFKSNQCYSGILNGTIEVTMNPNYKSGFFAVKNKNNAVKACCGQFENLSEYNLWLSLY